MGPVISEGPSTGRGRKRRRRVRGTAQRVAELSAGTARRPKLSRASVALRAAQRQRTNGSADREESDCSTWTNCQEQRASSTSATNGGSDRPNGARLGPDWGNRSRPAGTVCDLVWLYAESTHHRACDAASHRERVGSTSAPAHATGIVEKHSQHPRPQRCSGSSAGIVRRSRKPGTRHC